MEILSIIYIAVGVIYLICFFVLLAYVSTIKGYVSGQRSQNAMLRDYYKYVSFGDNLKAKQYLQEFIWSIIDELQFYEIRKREDTYNNYKEKYSILFDRIGENFPELLDLSDRELSYLKS